MSGSSSPDSYEAFALAYDRALGETFHRVIASHLETLDQRFPPETPVTHLDVACGTGLVLEWARRRGWHAVGVDASMSMIAAARGRGRAIAGDMRALPLAGSHFDRVTCVYDSLNHLISVEDLRQCFRSIREVMAADAMFWFDVNHTDAYTKVWALDEPFEASGDDWHLEIATSWNPATRRGIGRVTGHATIGGRRVAIDEVHEQRPWTDREIRAALRESGMRVEWRRRFEPFGTGGERDGLKVLYAARAV